MPNELTKNQTRTGKEPSFSVDFINMLVKEGDRLGIDPEWFFKKVGFDSNLLKAPNGRLPAEQGHGLASEVLKLIYDPDIGLHLGEAFDFFMDAMHVITFNSPTLGEALTNFCKYYPLMHDVAVPVFSQTGNTASLSLELQYQITDMNELRQFIEGHFAYYTNLLTRLTGKEVRLDSVQFIHPSPSSTKEHERIFKIPVLFSQQENKMTFSKKHLDLPVLVANVGILDTLKSYAEKLQKKIYREDLFSVQVETAIIQNLLSGKTDIETISGQLAMSKRSLQIRLSKEGVKYQDILDKVKREHAIQLLEQSRIAIIDITFLLGYSEQSAFNRAFKKWTGFTPGEYRQSYLSTQE
ncbi:MAG: AraC family transcriptional regulator [Thermodesulfobacteriota bacterium]